MLFIYIYIYDWNIWTIVSSSRFVYKIFIELLMLFFLAIFLSTVRFPWNFLIIVVMCICHFIFIIVDKIETLH